MSFLPLQKTVEELNKLRHKNLNYELDKIVS